MHLSGRNFAAPWSQHLQITYSRSAVGLYKYGPGGYQCTQHALSEDVEYRLKHNRGVHTVSLNVIIVLV